MERLGLLVCVACSACGACGDNSPPPAPLVHIVPDSSGWRDEYELGVESWSRLGFALGDDGVECPRYWYRDGETNCTITIHISLWPRFRERYGADAAAHRETRGIVIDDRYTGHLLHHLVAHEVGHVLLDAGHHDGAGIMSSRGTADTAATGDDYAHACRAIGLCVH